MPVLVIPENEIAMLGLRYAGFDDKRQLASSAETNLKRFRDSFGALPLSCAQMIVDFQSEDLGELRIVKPNIVYMLMSLCWMHTYVTEHALAGMFNITENTVRKWCWFYARAIQGQKCKKVRSVSCFLMIEFRLMQI
jgi:hypothetical protein